jgi:endogenous inhibitor of DNA gyrase (YacG/DUF329 family)
MRDRDPMKNDPAETTRRFRCPICKRSVEMPKETSAGVPRFFPFCSERCKLIDLGAWFDAGYRIATKPDEEPEESPGEDPPVDREDLDG